MKKRIITSMLALSMLVPLMPTFDITSFADTEYYIYQVSDLPDGAIMNRKMMSSNNFLSTFASGLYNVADIMGLNPDMKETTNYYYFGYAEDADGGYDTDTVLRKYGELIRFGGTFQGDSHKKVGNHAFKNKKVYQRMSISGHDIDYYLITGPGGDSTSTLIYKDENGNEFVPCSTDPYIHVTRGGECGCGSPKFSKPVINIADGTAPTITGWYVTFGDDMKLTAPDRTLETSADVSDDNPENWEDIYIHLEFSENMRFADHSAAHQNVYLGVRLADRATNQEVSKTFYAKLYALRDNRVSFKLDTADFMDKNHRNYLNGRDLNHFILKFTGITEEKDGKTLNALDEKDGYNLDIILGKESVLNTNKYNSLKNYISNTENGMKYVNTLFTDLAGNPLATTKIDNLVGTSTTNRIYADSLHPYIESIDFSVERNGQIITAEQENGEEIDDFIRPGDRLIFDVKFSEEVVCDYSNSSLTVNASGVYINGTNKWVQKDGNNDATKKTVIRFRSYIDDNAVPRDGETIELNTANIGGYDKEGNGYVNNPNTGTFLQPLTRKFKMDVLPPTITMNNETNENGEYIPKKENENVLSLDFTLTDSTDHGRNHASGFVGSQATYGSFIITNKYGTSSVATNKVAFKYAIVQKGSEMPKEEEFLTAKINTEVTFPQITSDGITSENILYIIPPEDFPVEYFPMKGTLKSKDYVGNETKLDFDIEAADMSNMIDKTPPQITVTGSNMDYNSETDEGTLDVSFSVYDMNVVNATEMKYAFVDKGAEPKDSDWMPVGAGADSTLIEVNKLEYDGDLSASGQAKEFDFYVYAEDMSYNKNSIVFGPYALSFDYQYYSHTVDAQEKTYAEHPKLYINGVRGTENAYVYTILRPENPEYFFGDNGLFANGECLVLRKNVDNTKVNAIDAGFVNSAGDQIGWYGTYDALTRTFTPIEADFDYLEEVFDGGIGNYYGKVRASYLLGVGLKFDENFKLVSDNPIFESREYEFWYAGKSTDEKPIITVDAGWVNGEALLRPEWSPGDEWSGSLQTLAGEIIRVDITANMERDFGLDIIDTENSYVRLVDDNYNILYEENITGGQMKVVIPDGIQYTEGKHKVHIVVIVNTKFGTQITGTYDALDIYVDNGDLSDFGLAALVTNVVKDGVSSFPNDLRDKSNKIDWYGYEKSHASESVEGEDAEDREKYQRPARLVLNAHEASNGVYHEHFLSFTEKSDVHGSEYMQVQNITDGVEHIGAWHNEPSVYVNQADGKTCYKVVVYDSLEELNAVDHGESEIPLLANTDNLISYRKVRENGKQSPVYTMTVYPDTTMEETLIEWEPVNEGPVARDVQGIIKAVPMGATIYHYGYDENNVIQWETIDDITVPITNNAGNVTGGFEQFYIVDMDGNIDYYELEYPANLCYAQPGLGGTVGMKTPNVAYFELSSSHQGNTYLTEYGAKLHVEFDDEYAKKIGTDNVTFEIPPVSEWNTDGSYGAHIHETDEASRLTGIYAFELEELYDGRGIEIQNMYMQHRYDSDMAEGAKETVTVTFTLEDIAGNVSMPQSFDVEFTNIEPKIIEIRLDENVTYSELAEGKTFKVPKLVATVPIDEVYPSTHAGAEDWTMQTTPYGDYWEKSFLNVYRDGNHKVSYLDMFGEIHTETVRYEGIPYSRGGEDDEVYDLGMDLTFSEPDPETGKVTLNYKSVDDRIIVDIAQVTGQIPTNLIPLQQQEGLIKLKMRVTEAEVELDPAYPLYILIYDPDAFANNSIAYMGVFAGGRSQVLIPNFVKRPIQADVEWYFSEFKTSYVPTLIKDDGTEYKPETTNKNVTVQLVTDRYVNGLNGKSTEYTFTYGGDTEYLFEFEDLSGVKGELYVSLEDIPITLTEPIPDVTDTQAPEYALNIFGKYNFAYESVNSYRSDETGTTASDEVKATDWVQGYMLSFTAIDQSSVKMVVKESGADITDMTFKSAKNDKMSGITTNGMQVLIEKKNPDDVIESFDVVLIDSSDNVTVIPFNGDDFMIDIEPPYVISKDVVQTNLYEKTVYVLLGDAKTDSEAIRWIYPGTVKKVTEGQYAGKFALVFDKNKVINTRFADELGNEGTADIEINDIDSTAPKIRKITWAPGNGNDTSMPPEKKINTSVVALVEFDKQISDITFTDKYNDNPFIDVVLQNDQAVITFEDSNRISNPNWTEDGNEPAYLPKPWELTLIFTAVNGAVGEETLPALNPIIDKDRPSVRTMYYEDENTPKAPYADVVFEVDEDCFMHDTGNTLYKAGEQIKRRITENGYHAFTFTDEAGNYTRQVVEVNCIDNTPPLMLLKDLPEIGVYTSKNVTFSATMNEEGTITINGVTKNIAKPVDKNGDGIFQNEECNWAEFEISQNGGYKIIATDTVGLSTESYISVTTIDRAKPNVSFSPLTYTVMRGTDKAYVNGLLSTGINVWDNISAAENVKAVFEDFDEALLSQIGVHPISYTVTDEAGNETTETRYLKIFSDTEPLITLNGEKTFRNEITLLDNEQITIDISKLPDGDGEPYSVYMRKGKWKEGQMKTKSEKLTTNTFTAEKEKYYTIYIVTQSRGTYITHFYVQ